MKRASAAGRLVASVVRARLAGPGRLAFRAPPYNGRLEILIGLVIGAVVGATGLGGGVLTAPFLILFAGLPPAQSVGTALLFSATVKISGAALYLLRKQVDFRVLAYLLAGGVPGAIAGALGLERVRSASPNATLLILVGATVAVSAAFSLLRPKVIAAPPVERPGLLPWLSFPIGLGVGFSSAGAGALGTLLLFGLTSLKPAVVVGTDLVFGMALSAVGGGFHIVSGNWDRALLLRLALGGLAGAAAGSAVASALPGRILRSIVLAWAMLLGLLLVRRGLGGG